jgi:hypothetical protein
MTYAVRSLMFHVDELSSRLSPTMVYTSSSLIGRKRNSSWSSTWRCRLVRNARLPHRKYFHRNNPSLVGPALLAFFYPRCCDQYLSVSSLDQRYGVLLTCARPCNALTIALQVALVAWAFVRQFSSSSWWISPSDMRPTRLFY